MNNEYISQIPGKYFFKFLNKNIIKKEDIRRVLLTIPEFKQKETLLPYFVAYDFPEKQQYLLKFWERVILEINQKCFKRILFTKKDLKKCFYSQKFYPLGFDKIIVQ